MTMSDAAWILVGLIAVGFGIATWRRFRLGR